MHSSHDLLSAVGLGDLVVSKSIEMSIDKNRSHSRVAFSGLGYRLGGNISTGEEREAASRGLLTDV